MMLNSMKDKRILITGATGLIGSHLVKKCLAEGAYVIALGRKIDKLTDVFADEKDSEYLQLCAGNIIEGIPDNVGFVDYIFHAASPISGMEIRTQPVNTIEANLFGVRNCAEYLKKQKEVSKIQGRLIVFSSATVYGNFDMKMNRRADEEETGLADDLNSANAPYSESKRMIEVLANAYYIQYGVEIVIARIGYVYGYTKMQPDTAFYEFIKKAISGENVVMNNSGMGRRDNIYVEDVVDGLMMIAQNGKLGEAYNISSNGEGNNFRAMDEIAEIIVSNVNNLKQDTEIKLCVKPFEGERKPGLMLNNTKLKSLGWKLNYNLEDGIRETIKCYL